MDGGHALALGLAAAAAGLAGYALATGGMVKIKAQAGAIADSAGGRYGPGYDHLAQPGQIPGRLHDAHPLFRRPSRLGGHRADVACHGWGWFADAPAQEGL